MLFTGACSFIDNLSCVMVAGTGQSEALNKQEKESKMHDLALFAPMLRFGQSLLVICRKKEYPP